MNAFQFTSLPKRFWARLTIFQGLCTISSICNCSCLFRLWLLQWSQAGMSYGQHLTCWFETLQAAYTVGGRQYKPQAPYVEPGMCFVPYEGHSGRCVSVSYAPYTTAMPWQVGRLGGKGRSVSSLQHGLTTSQEPCQVPQQMLPILCLGSM